MLVVNGYLTSPDPYLLHNNLNNTNQGMPWLHANLTKNSTVPSVSGGTLWADEVNKVFYQFGGEFQEVPQQATLWAYDAILDQWNQSDVPDDVSRLSWGAGVAVNERAEGYYLGGWHNNHTTPGWSGVPVATSSMVRYDMMRGFFTNNTGPDKQGRAEGALLFLPASDNGLLVYFGGIVDPYINGTIIGSPMNTIYIYDINSAKWYSQTASGDVPDMRRRFCAGATHADDQSSYNIYLYGGLSMNGTAFDDVYILSLPSFTYVMVPCL
jgi:Kelch motif